MSKKWSRLILFALLTILVQILFVNKINFWGIFNPKVFAIFILLFPRKFNHIYLMLVAFALGAVVDFFSYTYGIAMASCVMIAFLRPYLFRIMYNRREDDDVEVKMSTLGPVFIYRYLFVGLLLFHIFYFFTELGEITNVFYVLLKSVLSVVLCLLLYALAILMFTANKKGK